jgi:hypothetical protein
MSFSGIAYFMKQVLRHLTQFLPPKRQRSRRGRSPFWLIVLVGVWCVLGGVGLSHWASAVSLDRVVDELSAPDAIALGTVDPVTPAYELGEELYLENCATCHIALSPAVLPSQTWRQILEQPERHYGVSLPPMLEPTTLLIWNYLRQYSRPYPEGEPIPVQVNFSRHFNALHPRVDVPRPVTPTTCVSCHPGANQYDFRTLTPEWQ